MATNRAKPNTLNKPEYINFIKENVEGTSFKELTEMFNKKFNTEFTKVQINSLAKRYGLKNNISHYERFVSLTKEERKFIDENYKGINDQQLLDKLNEKFKNNRTIYMVMGYKKKNRYITGIDGKFQKGHKPYNKVDIGEERNTIRNVPRIKISDTKSRKDWKYKHRYLYEKYHNCKLTENDFIIFLDGDTSNYSKENLFCLSKEEFSSFYGNKLNKNDTDLSKAGALLVKIKFKIKELEK